METKSLHAPVIDERQFGMNPHKFSMWLFMVSIVMIFAGLTSAYIVRQGEGQWLEYTMPKVFYVSTAILLLSSFSLQWSYKAAKNENLKQHRLGVFITLGFGLAFLVGQMMSWQALVAQGVYFVGNPAGSFMYVLTGVHAFHLVSGIFVLIYLVVNSFRVLAKKDRLVKISICTTYWHFLDMLWLYLFVFLLLNH